MASAAVLAGIVVPAVAGVASLAVLAGMAFLAVVEVATSTDWMEAVGYLGVCDSRSIGDCLSLEGDVTDSDAVSIPDDVELGNHTVETLPTTGFVRLVAAGDRRDLDLICLEGRMDSDSRPERLDLPQVNDEAIVVGAIGSGAPWFLSGWTEGTEVEFMIDTGFMIVPGDYFVDVGVRTNVHF